MTDSPNLPRILFLSAILMLISSATIHPILIINDDPKETDNGRGKTIDTFQSTLEDRSNEDGSDSDSTTTPLKNDHDQSFKGSRDDSDEIRSRFQGPSPSPQNPRTTQYSDPVYAVITPSSFLSALQPLLDWKTQKGVPAQTYTLDEIYTAHPSERDNGARIQAFLRALRANNSALKWVLLVGDSEIIPARKLITNVTPGAEPDPENFAISDKIRADLRKAGVILEDTSQGIRWRRRKGI